ncbi:hypothetical protein J5277_20835, partial [Rhizobium sp. 16-449-1b]|uniref:hypothetical protein n=1 Tax=Rhizobium sp. 16-449-1b TaxID=2819989 RepID=UPI001ADD53E5
VGSGEPETEVIGQADSLTTNTTDTKPPALPVSCRRPSRGFASRADLVCVRGLDDGWRSAV